MMQWKLKRLLFIIIIITAILAYHSLISNYNFPNKKISEISQDVRKLNEDNEWIMLNTNVYLKRNFFFYLINNEMVKLFALSRINTSLNGLTGSLMLNEENIYFNKYSIQNIRRNSDFQITSIDIPFKSKNNLTSLKIRINGLEEILDIKIKDIHKPNKKYAIICGIPWELKNNAYKALKFWLEFNKIIGIDKISIYNNSIENSDNFNSLFKQYQDLIEIHNIKYYPMLKTNFTSKLEKIPRWCLESFFISECYFNNMDQYENILIIDMDELIIPKKFQSFYPIDYNEKFNKSLKIDYPSHKTDLNNYIDLLKEKFQINSQQSLHFKMGLYLSDKLVKKIFSKFKIFLINNFRLDYTNQKFEIAVKYTDPNNSDYMLVDYEDQPLDYIFTISNKQQFKYLEYLVDQYKTIYEPYFEQNSKFIETQMPEIYSRFYFLSGPFTNWHFGKTFHNTQINPTFLSHHHLDNSIDYQINPNYAHLSHFRSSYQKYLFGKISIDELYFDCNYFYAYFQKIKENFNNL